MLTRVWELIYPEDQTLHIQSTIESWVTPVLFHSHNMGNKRDHALSAIESIGYNTELYFCLGKAAMGVGGGGKEYRNGIPVDQESLYIF